MPLAGDNAAYGENTFSLAFPQKSAVEFWFADERGRLVTNIDKLRCNHRYRKRDRDSIALGDLSTRRLHDDAAGVRFCVRLLVFLFFVLRKACANDGNGEKARDERHETAKCR